MTAVIQRTAPEYPARLGATPQPPPELFALGAVPLPDADLIVAIVGARAASGRRMALAREVAAELAAGGALVVSGGAIGIDSAAHLGALDAGRPTVAVLAGGLDAPYPPRNRPLFDEIIERGGTLLAASPPGTAPQRRFFVARNAVIAGLCDATVVVEAQAASGSLHTARAALRYGRMVAAVPGSPGCEALLAGGAAVVESAADLLSARAGRPRQPTARLPEPGSREALVLDALDGRAPSTGPAVAARSGLGLREATRALVGLELEGLALALPGQAYLRSPLAERLRVGAQ
ncbi:MAG TPA: DNA-processing protein DprA [Kofleriaceae bacterium]|nr:DNA-processing protein DprA [Kofleriaceae bacterium]